MDRWVIVQPLVGATDRVALDVASGRLRAVDPVDASIHRGLCCDVAGQLFALYADDGTLWFQWDARRWPFMDDDLPVRYGHDHVRKTTTFAVADQSVTYEAWWSDDPLFEPLVPENDEVMDNLGYYHALKREPERLRQLLAHWNAA